MFSSVGSSLYVPTEYALHLYNKIMMVSWVMMMMDTSGGVFFSPDVFFTAVCRTCLPAGIVIMSGCLSTLEPQVGRDYGIRNVGHLALRCLRIEKFIPFWGEELTGDTTPNEVNRAYKIKFDKQHFVGKTSLLAERNQGVTKRLVQLHLEAFDSELELWPGGGETIYRHGKFVGWVRRAATDEAVSPASRSPC